MDPSILGACVLAAVIFSAGIADTVRDARAIARLERMAAAMKRGAK